MDPAREMTVPVTSRLGRAAIGVLAVVAALGFGISACRAGGSEILVGGHHALRATLANVTVLSDAAMSQQTGGRLRSPAVGNDEIGRQPVLLWDELHAKAPVVPPAGSGSGVTITINGPGN